MLTGIWHIAEKASLLNSLRRVAALGFRYVDIHGVFHGGPAHLSETGCKEIAAAMEILGLVGRNYVLHPLTNPAAANDAQQPRNLDYLKRGFDLASTWGINQIMLNAGQWSYGENRHVSWQRSVDFLQQVCEAAAQWNIFIAQEPEPYVWFLVNDLVSAKRMLDEVGMNNFTLLVDLGHMALARESPDDLEAVKENIIHLHLSDHQADLHTNQPIGTGVTRTMEYLAWLRDAGIDQSVKRFRTEEIVASFELGVPGDRIEDPDGWVNQSLAYIQEVAPYLGFA
jgi:sugar phosphate isomerase/epimerase